MSLSLNATALKTFVFIDANLENYQHLTSGVVDEVEVRVLAKQQNGIVAVTNELQKFADTSGSIDAIHILSHGSEAQLQLGSATLNPETLEQYKSLLQRWKSLLSDEADLLIYGCNVAAGEGASFVQQLGELTGANVAASVDLTGSSAKGGNWNLAFQSGQISASAALKDEVIASYDGVLQIRTVTTAADDSLNPGSLRSVIAAATAGDTIVFDSSLANQTITLTSGEIRIDPGKNITIDGANAANLTLSGNNASRVFLVDANIGISTNATIKNLKIVNGYVNASSGAGPTNDSTRGRGGAIAGADEATLAIENVEFNNNVADLGGGAIYTAWNSNLSVINSKFDGNQAIAGNDERGAGAIAFVSPGTFTVRNSEFTNNRGIVGGAINSLNGKLTIENSRFVNNDTESAFFASDDPIDPFLRGYGGAIYTDRASSSVEESQGIGGTIRITGSVFDNNRSKGGGGATHLFTSPTDRVIIEDTTYTNNKTAALPGGEGGSGGALYQLSDAPNRGLTITNTTFANNTAAAQGGGAWLFNAPTTITNSTFTGNSALLGNFAGNGGAIAILSAANANISTDIVNTTIANNFANGIGGGVFASDPPQVNLKNTIFANNTVGNQFGSLPQSNRKLTDQGGNIQWPPIDNPDFLVTNNITVADPNLGSLQEINGKLVLPLLPGSAAIDTGTGAGAPTTDQRGVTRPIDGDGNGSAIVDAGSFEFNGGNTTQAPEISVLNDTVNIVDGTTTPLDFGTTVVGNPLTKIFTLNNTGTDILSLTTPTLPTGFSLVGDFPTSIASGASANFTLQLDATTAGNPNGTISFGNNDSDENPFDFALAGSVTPIINPINTIVGTSQPDVLVGTNGSDRIIGEQSTDRLTGGGGNDEFVYNRLEDTTDTIVDFEVGSDKIVFTNLLASLGYNGSNPIADGIVSFANWDQDSVILIDSDGKTGEALPRIFTLLYNVDTVALSNPNNFVFSPLNLVDPAIAPIVNPVNNGTNTISGTPHSDVSLATNGGNNAINTITGTPLPDVLTGTNGSDRIIGEQSSDVLKGGGGNDEFVYNTIHDTTDTILDFQVGSDKFVMTNLLASFGYSGSNPIADGIVSFGNWDQDSVLLIDSDGNAGSASPRIFTLLYNVDTVALSNPNNFVF